jgi:NTP pyrophosphatase (non-canonical NTP hydrolase)
MGIDVIPASELTFAEYEQLSERTMNTSNQTFDEQLANIALGLAGEAGEIADMVKKHLHHGHDLDLRKLELEAGDLLFYLAWLPKLLGLSLEAV